MITRQVWLITAEMEYEGSLAISVHSDLSRAQEFLKLINDYHATRCDVCIIPGPHADDSQWDDYKKQLNWWEERHPAGKDASTFDYFQIVQVTMRD